MGARHLRRALLVLTGSALTPEELARRVGMPLRSVRALLAACGHDVETGVAGVAQLRIERHPAYVAAFALDAFAGEEPGDALADLAAANAGLLALLQELVAGAPPPRRVLDHVPATPGTVLRRALWMRANFDLSGRRVLFVGDHDLTCLACTLLIPGLVATVVDIDDSMLAYIDACAARLGVGVRVLWADLRAGLPPAAAGAAELAFTDPPYTPDGVALFAHRALAGLADRQHGRVVLAYGHGGQPGLGFQVQRRLSDMRLVLEAVLPDFNAYAGAPAIGSTSDLYVCRPTSATWTVLRRTGNVARIYTRGPEAVEASGHTSGPVAAAHALAGEDARVVDLTASVDEALVRALLATPGDRVALIVRNPHPDVRDATGQAELAELLAARWRVRFHRSVPGPATTVLVADSVPADGLAPEAAVARHMLDRPHGKIANTWREGLARHAGLTRNAARAVVAQRLPSWAGEARLVDLPRHLLQKVLTPPAVPPVP